VEEIKQQISTLLIKSYIAGLFDGEGSITILRLKSNEKCRRVSSIHNLNIRIANTNKEVLEMVKELFGGGLHISNRTHRICYSWTASGNIAWNFLKHIIPFLRIKKQQAQLGIDFHESIAPHNNIKLTQEQLDFREEYKQKITDLNKGTYLM